MIKRIKQLISIIFSKANWCKIIKYIFFTIAINCLWLVILIIMKNYENEIGFWTSYTLSFGIAICIKICFCYVPLWWYYIFKLIVSSMPCVPETFFVAKLFGILIKQKLLGLISILGAYVLLFIVYVFLFIFTYYIFYLFKVTLTKNKLKSLNLSDLEAEEIDIKIKLKVNITSEDNNSVHNYITGLLNKSTCNFLKDYTIEQKTTFNNLPNDYINESKRNSKIENWASLLSFFASNIIMITEIIFAITGIELKIGEMGSDVWIPIIIYIITLFIWLILAYRKTYSYNEQILFYAFNSHASLITLFELIIYYVYCKSNFKFAFVASVLILILSFIIILEMLRKYRRYIQIYQEMSS